MALTTRADAIAWIGGHRLETSAGITMSLLTVMGARIARMETPVFTMPSVPDALLLALALLVLGAVYTILVARLYGCIQSARASGRAESTAGSPADANRFGPGFRRTVLVRAGVLLLCWLPYFVCGLPGSIHGDYVVQLLQFMGNDPMSNHHPVLTTWLYGVLYQAGLALGDPTMGVLLTTVFQALLLSATLSLCVTTLQRLGAPRSWCLVALGIFGLVPVIPMYALFCVKDTPSLALFSLFALQLCARTVALRAGQETRGPVSLPAIAAMAFACALMRNNFVFCVAPAILALPKARARLFVRDDGERGAQEGLEKTSSRTPNVVAAALVFVAVVAWNTVVTDAMGVERADPGGAFSVPVQQIASYVAVFPQDLTPEERETLEASTRVSLEDLGNRYDYKISDPVKRAFTVKGFPAMLRLGQTWLTMGLRHPDLYVLTFLKGNFGYWYPYLDYGEVKWASPFVMSPEGCVSLIARRGYDLSGEAEPILSMRQWLPDLRTEMRVAVETMGNTPVLALFFEPAFYIWLTMLLCAWIVRRGGGGCSLAVMSALLFLTLCASPDFSNMRYALPFLAIAPLSLLYATVCGNRATR